MSKHTPEPWPHFVDVCCHATLHPESYGLAKLGFSDYHRAMKCVNACAGMEDPAADIAELKQQRDELLSAAKLAIADCVDLVSTDAGDALLSAIDNANGVTK